jgi:hypothetical protein
MNIHVQFGFNHICEKKAFEHFPIGSNVNATTGHRLTLEPMGKCSNVFFSETTNQTESKLDRNFHWMILYKYMFFVPIFSHHRKIAS